jgi:hypothetical protein
MNTIHVVGGPLHELVRTPYTYQMHPLYVPFQLQPMTTLQERNEVKRQAAIEWLGTRWILHPENNVGRIGDV